jgi:two-component system chemotaxis response regulator CheB
VAKSGGNGSGTRRFTVQNTLKVLVVDDSKLIRRIVRGIFQDSAHIEVVGEAANGAQALELIPQLSPDVVTLDVNMPVMDGLTTLKHIMIRNPVPTVMFSTLTREGATETFDALRYGAVDFMLKPSRLSEEGMEEQKADITERVSMAAHVEMGQIRFLPAKPASRPKVSPEGRPCRRVVAVGAAEGGYGALLRIIPQLPAELDAALVAVLYASSVHIDAFARYLDDHSRIRVRRAQNRDRLQAGCCYLTSGSEYATIDGDDGAPRLRLTPSPFPNRRGTIDMLMISAADCLKNRASGIILTGGGKDGVEGAGEISRRGGTVLVQDPRTCLFREMPNAAIVTGKYSRVLADADMAKEIHRLFEPKAGG